MNTLANIMLGGWLVWLALAIKMQTHPAVKGQGMKIRALAVLVGPPMFAFDLLCYGLHKARRPSRRY